VPRDVAHLVILILHHFKRYSNTFRGCQASPGNQWKAEAVLRTTT